MLFETTDGVSVENGGYSEEKDDKRKQVNSPLPLSMISVKVLFELTPPSGKKKK